MTVDQFSDALNLIDEKYIIEATEYSQSRYSRSISFLRRVACFVIAVFLAGVALIAFDLDVNALLSYWNRQQNNDIVSYIPNTESTISEAKKYELTWMPEGCEIWDVFEMDSIYHCAYKYDDYIVAFTYSQNISGVSVSVITEGTVRKTVWVNGNAAELYLSVDSSATNGLVWEDSASGYLFALSGPFDEETLIKMAESIREVENTP